MAHQNKIERIEQRLADLEQTNVLRGHARGNTKQAKAIAFVVANMEALQELIEKSNGNQS